MRESIGDNQSIGPIKPSSQSTTGVRALLCLLASLSQSPMQKCWAKTILLSQTGCVGWYLPPQKIIPLTENRFLQAGKGAENTKGKISGSELYDEIKAMQPEKRHNS